MPVCDVVEELAIARAKELFGCEHVNVQPHSGSQANMAAYLAVLKPGDTILGMSLAHGGHLTNGSRVSFSGKLFQSFSYGVDRETEAIDYDAVEKQANEAERIERTEEDKVSSFRENTPIEEEELNRIKRKDERTKRERNGRGRNSRQNTSRIN